MIEAMKDMTKMTITSARLNTSFGLNRATTALRRTTPKNTPNAATGSCERFNRDAPTTQALSGHQMDTAVHAMRPATMDRGVISPKRSVCVVSAISAVVRCSEVTLSSNVICPFPEGGYCVEYEIEFRRL